MNVLFVHGMGRTPVSGWPLLYQLRQSGLKTASFSYRVSAEPFAGIQARLEKQISEIAHQGDYILVGHSLGGVLIRAALGSLQEDTRQPAHVFLLGSPIKPARLAQQLGQHSIFRAVTRDCGNFLGSEERMSGVGGTASPTTSIVGTRGITWKHGPFKGEDNDGIVSLSEVSAKWLTDEVRLPIVHSLLPSSSQVARIILQRLNIKTVC